MEVTLCLHYLKLHGMHERKIFPFSITSRQAIGPTSNGQWGMFLPGNKPVRECGWPLVSNFLPCAWVKKAIPQLPCVLKTWCLTSRTTCNNILTFANHFQYIKNTNILCQMFLQVIYIYAIDLSRPFICT